MYVHSFIHLPSHVKTRDDMTMTTTTTMRDPNMTLLSEAMCALLDYAVADDVVEHVGDVRNGRKRERERKRGDGGGGGFSLRAIHPRGVNVNALCALNVRNMTFHVERGRRGVILRVYDDDERDDEEEFEDAEDGHSHDGDDDESSSLPVAFFRSPHRSASAPSCCVQTWTHLVLGELGTTVVDPHVEYTVDRDANVEVTFRVRPATSSTSSAAVPMSSLRRIIQRLPTSATVYLLASSVTTTARVTTDGHANANGNTTDLTLWVTGRCGEPHASVATFW